MRDSIIFEYDPRPDPWNNFLTYRGVTEKTRDIRICKDGFDAFLVGSFASLPSQRFRVTVRKKRFKHSIKIYTNWGASGIRKNGSTDSRWICIYGKLSDWVCHHFPGVIKQSKTTFYIGIEWL